ncbi:MAG: PH domain-containing protein [Bacteroidales bacterium]|nr:PH domain-containing protein [Bacteroidales bacterium]
MDSKQEIIRQAEFNERIQKYIFWIVTFYLFVSVAGIPLIIFWVAGIGQTISRRYYEKLQCMLTETHLEYKKGVLFRVEKTIPLENIQDLTFLDNPFLRWFDLRILKIETAGSSNPQGSDMRLIGIIDTPAFKEEVLNQRTIIRNKDSEGSPGRSRSEDDKQMALLMEIRDLLREIRDRK